MNDIIAKIQTELMAMGNSKYREFQCKLMPTVDPGTVIGIRVPDLRSYALKLSRTEAAAAFLKSLPHRYYEENNLHAFLIEQIKDYGMVITELERFLPYVNNWATCDMMRPKILKKHLPELKEKIDEWMASDEIYTVRYGIGMMMYYLDDAFESEFLAAAAELKTEEYYINMMRAWYFAEALVKQYEAAVKFIEERRLDIWTHNKAIQKATESYRLSEDTKNYQRSLKIKNK